MSQGLFASCDTTIVSGLNHQLRSCFEIGNDLMRFPVAANIALHNAGGAGGSAGSPRPVTGESDSFQWTSIEGARPIRINGLRTDDLEAATELTTSEQVVSCLSPHVPTTTAFQEIALTFDSDNASPRRQFITRAAAAIAVITGLPAMAAADSTVTDNEHEHDAWMKAIKARHRQFFHAMDLGDRAMLLASNFLDAYRDAFAAKPGDAAAVIGVHGSALAIGFNDSAWAKYGFAKAPNLLDPSTKEVAARNVFASGAPLSVDTLQKRGVIFLMCNTALRFTSQALAKARNETPEAVYDDLKASRLPGTILVPAMVVAINRAQEAGFTYLRV